MAMIKAATPYCSDSEGLNADTFRLNAFRCATELGVPLPFPSRRGDTFTQQEITYSNSHDSDLHQQQSLQTVITCESADLDHISLALINTGSQDN